jgi:hypothetical protein
MGTSSNSLFTHGHCIAAVDAIFCAARGTIDILALFVRTVNAQKDLRPMRNANSSKRIKRLTCGFRFS